MVIADALLIPFSENRIPNYERKQADSQCRQKDCLSELDPLF